MEENQQTKALNELKKLMIIVAVALVGVIIVGIASICFMGLAGGQNNQGSIGLNGVKPDSNTITVSYTQKDKAVPDVANINFGVSTESQKANDCLTQNSTQVNRVMQSIKNLGIGEDDIQTNGYKLFPQYNYADGTQELSGYKCTTNITLSDIAIDTVGKVLDQSASEGVNYIDSVQYSYSKYEEAYSTALTEATGKCKERAEKIAEKNGYKILGIQSMNEDKSNSGGPILYESSKIAAADAGSATQATPGQISVDASVTVTYLIGK